MPCLQQSPGVCLFDREKKEAKREGNGGECGRGSKEGGREGERERGERERGEGMGEKVKEEER